MNEEELRKLMPELFGEDVDKRHDKIMYENADLHQGKHVKFDGRVETGETTYPEFELHNATNSLRYMAQDEKDDVLKEQGNFKGYEY